MNFRVAAPLVFLVFSGCVDDAEPTGDLSLRTPEVATSLEWTPPGSFVDGRGLEWVQTEKVVYDYGEDKEYPEDPKGDDEVPLDPRKATDLEWALYMEPASEFGAYEYRLTDQSLKKYGKRLRKLAIQRLDKKDEEYGEEPGLPTDPDIEISKELPKQPDEKGPVTKAIVGANDNRIVIDHLRDEWPWMMHGAMKRPTTTGGSSFCTAFKIINEETAGTAAHCVHTGDSWKSRSEITFSDGSRGSVDADCYIRTVNRGWAERRVARNDYAVIGLRREGSPAWCSYKQFKMGWFGWRRVPYFSEVNGFISGYPASSTVPPPLVGVTPGWPHLVYHFNDEAEVGTFAAQILKHYNDATGGQSGAPFVTWYGGDGFYVRGIHKGEGVILSFVEFNRAREFDGDLADFMRENGGSPDPEIGVIVQ